MLLERVEAMARELAQYIARRLPAGWGFGLFMFTYGEGGVTTWISSANRSDMHAMLREYLDKSQSGEENELGCPT